MALLGISLSGCSYSYAFLIVNLTAHDLIVMYKYTGKSTGCDGLNSDPKVFTVKAKDSDYAPDSLLHELSFGLKDTVRVVVPSHALFIGGEFGRPKEAESYKCIEWLMVVRTDLGDTLKVPGSMIIDLIQEVNDQDVGLIIDEKAASL